MYPRICGWKVANSNRYLCSAVSINPLFWVRTFSWKASYSAGGRERFLFMDQEPENATAAASNHLYSMPWAPPGLPVWTGGYKLVQKAIGTFVVKSKMHISFDPAILIPGIYPVVSSYMRRMARGQGYSGHHCFRMANIGTTPISISRALVKLT